MTKIKILLLIFILSFLFASSLKSAVWEPVPYNFNYQAHTILFDMAVLDSNNAYAALLVQGNPIITSVRHSIDGGETWSEIYVKETYVVTTDDLKYWIPEKLQVPAPNHIFLQTKRSIIYNTLSNARIRHSRDNGLTWDSLLIINEYISNGDIDGLVMYDTLVGAVTNLFDATNDMPEHYPILPIVTEDGWQTAKILRPDLFFNEYIGAYHIHFFSPRHFGFLSAGTGFDMPHLLPPPTSTYYYWTEDGGETWERSNAFYSIEGFLSATNRIPFFHSSYFVNDTLGWLVGARSMQDGDAGTDVIMKTTDGGRTWKLNYLQANSPMMGLNDISCKDEMNCVAVGNWGKVLRTTDGGETWVQEYSENAKFKNRLRMRVAHIGSKAIIGSSPSDPMFWREKTTSILEPLLTSSALQVFPNPTDAHTTVALDLETAGNLTVTLNNMLGQELLEIHNGFADVGEFSRTFSLKKLPIGVYYLKIVHNGNVKVEKVIRN